MGPSERLHNNDKLSPRCTLSSQSFWMARMRSMVKVTTRAHTTKSMAPLQFQASTRLVGLRLENRRANQAVTTPAQEKVCFSSVSSLARAVASSSGARPPWMTETENRACANRMTASSSCATRDSTTNLGADAIAAKRLSNEALA